jgi:parvulin-like peptidyl-prolyl isomerase
MTFRNRIAPKPTRRRVRQDDSRRTLLLNIAFGLATLAALAMLGGVIFANWYGDHWAAIATVGGEQVNKDTVRDRAAVNKARYDRQLRNYGQLRNMGQITTDDYANFASAISDKQGTLYQDSLDQLTDELVLKQYADKHGINVGDSQVNAQIEKDATIPQMRHVLVLAVEPTSTPPASSSSAAEMQAAQAKAQKYVDDLRSGAKKWETVASEVNQYLNSSSDLGMITADNTALDPPISEAVFKLAKVNDVTDVFKSDDGLYRFATITGISPAFVDTDWQRSIDSSAKADVYKALARGLAVRAAVKDAVLKQYVETPTVQRQVREIAMRSGYGQPGDGDEVAFRMMVFAPDHDLSGAATVAADSPSWADAKNRAEQAAATLRTDPSKFEAMARDMNINDDGTWSSQGGLLPWLQWSIIQDAQGGVGLPNLANELYKPHAAKDIIGPVLESSQGYVVAEFLGIRSAPEIRIADIQLLLATGVRFDVLARQHSEWPDAVDGGDMGWVGRYQVSPEFESAIFQAPIGGVSRLCTQDNQGYWLFQVVDEQTRLPDAKEAAKLRRSLFDSWLTDLKAHTKIWTDTAGLDAISPKSS